MGINFSSTSSVGRYSNDFELIVRAAKELEELLEKQFGAPDGKDKGLHDKISDARVNGQPLPPELVKRLRYLVTIRNKIIHDYDFNAIPNRLDFVKSFDDAVLELKRLKNIIDSQQGCVVQ